MPMRRRRNAKIMATLGPASSKLDTIRALFEAGVDLFRLNLSHGTHAEHRARLEAIRRIEAEYSHPIGILVDLQGPKLRIGELAGGHVTLRAGQAYRLDLSAAPGGRRRAPLPHPEVFGALEDGAEILLDDGLIRLRVERHGADFADTRVITGGQLAAHKGLNVPRTVLPVTALTAKDQRDLQFGLDHRADIVALSFVQRADDVAAARKLIAGRAAVVTKLEKPAALDHFQEILDLSDAVMIARGDLGVEMDPEEVPAVQKLVVGEARRAGKPVIVATQMLESMVRGPAPTRAEASDVATAVYDGADALMLSAETAVGAYPCEAAAMMNRIIERVERDPAYRRYVEIEPHELEATTADAITAAARQVARTIHAAAIVTYTTSGSTALRAARERPEVPILALTPSLETARWLSLVWGVHCVHTEDATDFQDMTEKACVTALKEGFAQPGDRIVVTAGVPFGTPGATNVLRIAWVGT